MARLARITLALTLLGCLAAANVRAQGLAVAITGESNLRVTFMTQLREYAAEHKVPLEFVQRSNNPAYTLIIAQETGRGNASAAVIVLDRDTNVVASVVRSGRLSGKGAMNACAKEVAKQLAAIVAHR